MADMITRLIASSEAVSSGATSGSASWKYDPGTDLMNGITGVDIWARLNMVAGSGQVAVKAYASEDGVTYAQIPIRNYRYPSTGTLTTSVVVSSAMAGPIGRFGDVLAPYMRVHWAFTGAASAVVSLTAYTR
jgi:hypothetical protein